MNESAQFQFWCQVFRVILWPYQQIRIALVYLWWWRVKRAIRLVRKAGFAVMLQCGTDDKAANLLEIT